MYFKVKKIRRIGENPEEFTIEMEKCLLEGNNKKEE
jgi:hypothetical protein